MARKGQKFGSYSAELKEEILRKYWSRVPARALSVEYGIPQGTIETWNYNFKHGRIGRKCGRKKKNPTLKDYKERYEILKNIRPSYKHDEGKSNVKTIHINKYKLSNLCAALAISHRTYYKYRDKEDPDYYEYLLI